jgi:hypothetical protein
MPGEAGEGPVAFTSDGTPLQLVAATANTLQLWDVDRQRIVHKFEFAEKLPPIPLDAENQPVLALSADGTLVAASTKLPDGKAVLVVWEVASGKEVSRTGEKAEVIAFSPDKAILATGDDSGTSPAPVGQLEKGTTFPEAGCGSLSGIHRLVRGTRTDARRVVGCWLREAGGNHDLGRGAEGAPDALPGSPYDVYSLLFARRHLLASGGRYALTVDVATGRLLTLRATNTLTGVVFSQQNPGRERQHCTPDPWGWRSTH